VRIGLDLVSVRTVAEAIETHGERYLRRTYTDEELRECGGRPERLAARFAAKEAAMKALDRGDEPLPWTSIAIARGESGRPTVVLTGAAAALAERRGLRAFEVSLTHEGEYAAAVVVAFGSDPGGD
jgi:holo-[acyl-carrier protein] synthase